MSSGVFLEPARLRSRSFNSHMYLMTSLRIGMICLMVTLTFSHGRTLLRMLNRVWAIGSGSVSGVACLKQRRMAVKPLSCMKWHTLRMSSIGKLAVSISWFEWW